MSHLLSYQAEVPPAPAFCPGEPKRHDIGRTRYHRIVEAGVSGLVSKGAVLLVNLLSVPIAVRYLGAVQFGIWATISTSLSLLLVLDFGIANTLTNLISEAFARDDKQLAGRYASTAFWLSIGIAAGLGLVGVLIWPFVNWNYVFHVEGVPGGVVSRAVAVAYGVFLIGMPAGLGTKMLGGYQELRIANIFATVGSAASLAGVIVVTRLNAGLPSLIGASSGALILANIACLLWIWLYRKPWLSPAPGKTSIDVGRRLLQSGSEFFLIQLAGLVVFNSDNLVIAHFVGAAEVTPYNVTWRLVSYASALQTLMLPAVWPAYSEAFARGDMAWVRRAYGRLMKLTTLTTGGACLLLMLFGQTMIRHWAGSAAVPSHSLVIAMCVWVMISTIANNEACLLVATSNTRLQAKIGIAAAGINLACTIWLVQRIGVLGVILGTIISYLIVVIGPQTWKTRQLLSASICSESPGSRRTAEPHKPL
jgi:O-antigen/teichoic acid export membrane protein